MNIKIISTGSKGNSYILTNNKGEQLLIELGIKNNLIFKEINIRKVVGILISHTHRDHLFGNNYDIFKDFGVPMILPNSEYQVNKIYTIGDFKIIPLLAKHNVECYSYYIYCDNKYILFATDTNEIPKVKKIDILLGEVNYIESLSEYLTMNDSDNEYYHLTKSYKNHHSLESMEDYLYRLNYKLSRLLIIHWSKTKAFNKDKVLETLTPLVDRIEIVENGDSYEL